MATRQTQSLSAQWREKGNSCYRNVSEGLSPVLQKSRLQEAINHYDKAISLAEVPQERSSAHKNMAMANRKMAKAEILCTMPKNVMFHFKAALRHFQEAKTHGADQSIAWHNSLAVSAASCWEDIHDHVDKLDFGERVRGLEQLVLLSIDDVTKANEYYGITEVYFHRSLTFLGKRDYQRSLRFLAECNFPLKEAMRYGRTDSKLTRQCALMEEDITVQRCVAESIQARIKGEELLQKTMRDEESLNMDMVWEVVDWFCTAAMLTRERDLELEAMALSDLGKVYDKVLKMRDRAKACLIKVLELANSMVPRNFTGNEWYEFARSTVERYQQEQVKAEEDQHQKEREETLKLLKDELDVLRKKHKEVGKWEFLTFLYATHPPKNSAQKLKEMSEEPEYKTLKKLYQKALLHYHPDKVQVNEHGFQWKVFTEEITKLLTFHYESFKGCDPM